MAKVIIKKVPAPNPLIDQTGNQLWDRPYISVRHIVLHSTTTLVRAFLIKLTHFSLLWPIFRTDPDYLVSWALIAGWEELPAAHSVTVTSPNSAHTNSLIRNMTHCSKSQSTKISLNQGPCHRPYYELIL